MNETRLPGKDAPLETSIERMQRLLRHAGFDIEEAAWLNPAPHCWSVHIRDRDCPLLFTNGKGRSRDAALASALGEFFERLGTLYFFADYWFGPEHDRPGFSHHRDERWFAVEDDTAWPDGLLDDPALRAFYDPEGELTAAALIDLNTGDRKKGVCALPFVRQRDGETFWFPVNLLGNLYASNGTAAGNSRNEARVQALSEIFERAVKFKIIADGIVLPDVPEAVVASYPHVAEAIAALRDHGFGVLVKDASLGGRYPVVNVTLLNPEDGSCFASFGAHPRFEVALERTVTELLQGRDLDQLGGFSSPSFDTDAVADPLNLETHFIDSSGLIGWRFFSATPDFPFVAWDFDGSTAEEFRQLCQILHAEGKEIYIHDDDRLGVDVCRIVVPGFSEIYPVSDLLWDNNNAALGLRQWISDIATLDADTRRQLFVSLEAEAFDPAQPVAGLIGIAPDAGSAWESLRVAELSLRLALAIGDSRTASERLDWLLNFSEEDAPVRRRWQCLRDLLGMDGNHRDFLTALRGLYGDDRLAESLAMANGESLFDALTNPLKETRHEQLLAALDKSRATIKR